MSPEFPVAEPFGTMTPAAPPEPKRSSGLTPVPGTLRSSLLADTSSPPLLLFEQVSKWYGAVLGLNQVTLELRGGITGLVGANGAGKSTLIRLATGQARPSLGRVTILGVEAWHWTARRRVGYCPDHDAFYEDMTGTAFVTAMARLCGFDSRDAQRRTAAVLDRVGMTNRANRKIRGYSKGMRQRVKLAQALLHNPDLLVLDEPLSGVDPVGRQELLTLFRGLAADGKGILISSHELEELERLTNHVIVMARGRVAAVGTLQRIRDLMDDLPLSIRIDVDRPRDLARRLLELDEVMGADVVSDAVAGPRVIVRACHPQRFFRELGRIVLAEQMDVHRIEPLDESAHAVLGYLLGGSGKT